MSLRSAFRTLTNTLYSPNILDSGTSSNIETFKDREDDVDDDYFSLAGNILHQEGSLASMVISKRLESEPFLKDTQRYKETISELDVFCKVTKGDTKNKQKFNQIVERLILSVEDLADRRKLTRYLQVNGALILNDDDESDADTTDTEQLSQCEREFDFIDEYGGINLATKSGQSSISELLKVTTIPSLTFPDSLIGRSSQKSTDKNIPNQQSSSFIDEEGIQLVLRVISYLNRKITFNKKFFTSFLNFLVFLNLLVLNLLKFCLNYFGNNSAIAVDPVNTQRSTRIRKRTRK